MQIGVRIKNFMSDDASIHVFDLFANRHREVGGSPFSLASGEVSAAFAVQAHDDGGGKIEWSVDGGPNETNVPVNDGDEISVS